MALAAASACAKQAEGERCDPLSGSQDCDDGLTCKPLEQLRSGAEGAVCCSANPTVNVCRNSNFDPGGDAGATSDQPAVPDAGAPNGSVSSGLGESSSDNERDASVDASESDNSSPLSSETVTSSTAPAAVSSEVATDVQSSATSTDVSSVTASSDAADTAVPDAAVPDAGP